MDELIPLVDYHKDLGVIFFHDLTWSAHYSRKISATCTTLHVVHCCFSVSNYTCANKKVTFPIPH